MLYRKLLKKNKYLYKYLYEYIINLTNNFVFIFLISKYIYFKYLKFIFI